MLQVFEKNITLSITKYPNVMRVFFFVLKCCPTTQQHYNMNQESILSNNNIKHNLTENTLILQKVIMFILKMLAKKIIIVD